jgi:L-asparaginase/Glu-tRNA(Gln) amidotransferase subunit D
MENRALMCVGESIKHTDKKEYSNVLVIVTGGTITMVNTENGYVSVTGLADRLKMNVALYDS